MSEYPTDSKQAPIESTTEREEAQKRAMMAAEREAQLTQPACETKRCTLSEKMQAIQKLASDNLRMAQSIEMALFGVTDPVGGDCGGEYSIERRAAETFDDLQQTSRTLAQILERLGE